MICDITQSLEADPGPVFSKCDMETSVHTHTENGPHSETGDILCPAAKLVTKRFTTRSNILEFCKEGERVGAILRNLMSEL